MERVTRHGRSLQHETRVVGEERELLGQRTGNGIRHIKTGHRRVGHRRVAWGSTTERSRQLFEVERIATALVEEAASHGIVNGIAEEISGLLTSQRAEMEAVNSPDPVRPLKCVRQPVRRLTGTNPERDEHSRIRRPTKERTQQLDRCRISPMDIVEHEHEWLGRRKPLQQLPHRPVGAVPRLRNGGGANGPTRSQGRKDRRELAEDVVIKLVEPARF